MPHHRISHSIVRFAGVVAGTLGATLAYAQLPSWAPQPKPSVMEERFRAELGFQWSTVDTQLRIDPSTMQQGTRIDAEDDLALDETELIWQGELTLLPGDHHLIRLSGMNSRRTAQTILDRQIVFDDEIYQINERVDSELDLILFGLTYGYRFIATDRAELAATFGIQIAAVETNAVVRRRVIRESESGVAPLPLLGLEGRYNVMGRWSVEGRVQYLTAQVEDVDGTIMDARLAVTWRMNPHLVFGLGYRAFSVEIESEDAGTPGFVDMQIASPMLFVRASL